MNKIAVIHYLPLEFYPPVTNFLDVIGDRNERVVKVWTSKNGKKRKTYTNDNISNISRVASVNPKSNVVFRLLKYFVFNLNCLFSLILLHPKRILYYESYSAWPVYWYMRLFGKHTELFIHHHEYFSKVWYENGMKLNRFYHKYETNYLYNKAVWISQTNDDRVRLFLEDNPEVSKSKMKILPNYPPKKWELEAANSDSLNTDIIKVVYVGSLSLESTYIKEFCEWVLGMDGKVLFDIYAYNLSETTVAYFKTLNSSIITFFDEGIEYEKLPQVLSKYHVGVILYKATTDNFKFNAPNKLFEYLACNLTVWYPDVMKGISPYLSERVNKFDFGNLNELKYNADKIRCIRRTNSKKFYAEEAFAELVQSLKK